MKNMKKYYFHDGKEQKGPFDIEDLKSEKITRNTKIWYEGIIDWTNAGELKELEELFKATPPPITTKTAPITTPPLSKNKINKNLKIGLIAVVSILVLVGIFMPYTYSWLYHLTFGYSTEYVSQPNEIRESSDANMEDYTEERPGTNDHTRQYGQEWIKERNHLIKMYKESAANSDPSRSYKKLFEITPSRMAIKNNLIGGIFSFQMTIKNKTGYAFSEVRVQVVYLNKQREVVASHFININDLGKFEEKTFNVPESNRGFQFDFAIEHPVCSSHKVMPKLVPIEDEVYEDSYWIWENSSKEWNGFG